MAKAAADGRSASDIVRRSISDYLRGRAGHGRSRPAGWKYIAVGAAVGIAVVLLPVFSPATADYNREFEAARARLAFERGDMAERRKLAKEYAEEFAAQRLMLPQPYQPGVRHVAFSSLDLDSDRRLAFAEFRQLMSVPDGEPGRKLFQLQDIDRDGSLSENEFKLVEG